jgi:hypothetical protein
MSTQPQTQPQPIDYAPIIEGQRKALKAMETDRLGAEKDREHAQKRLDEEYAEVRALDVEPENLDSKIVEMGIEIFEGVVAATELIPPEYRKTHMDKNAFAAIVTQAAEVLSTLENKVLGNRLSVALDRADKILNPPAEPAPEN